MDPIGLIAGNRKFPLLVAESAKKQGIKIIAVAVRGDTLPALSSLVHQTNWVSLSQFSSMFEIFKNAGVKKVIMAGQISPWRLFSKEIQKDDLLRSLLANLKNKKADTIFSAIAQQLSEHGFELIDSTLYLKEYMPSQGTLTTCQPGFDVWEDVYFGFGLAKAIGSLDIGQTVAVKEKAVVAVEALEGTDNVIRRAGKLTRGGFSLVKTGKPMQDMRFDVPVVGLNTIKNLSKAKAACLAIEAGKTIFIDKAQSIALAQRKGIAIVAI